MVERMVAFWSEEYGCGITSGMAAVASVCADVWQRKIILLQSRNQEGDLCQKLGNGARTQIFVQEEDRSERRDGWDQQPAPDRNQQPTRERLFACLIPVVRGRMYYLPQGDYKKREKYPGYMKEEMRQTIDLAEQMSDLTFVDCGSGRDDLSEFLLSMADVAVIGISQERQNLDAYFQNRHVYRGNVVYLVNQYQQESIYNKKNLNRLFRLGEEELTVIPGNPVFRHVSDRGKTERFIRRHMQCRFYDHQYDFMKELMQTTRIILKAAGYEKTIRSPPLKMQPALPYMKLTGQRDCRKLQI